MSNEATAAKKTVFNEASAGKKPTLVCTGYVSKVDETHPAKSGNYNVTPIHINGIGASLNTTVYLLTRPEWFEVDGDGRPSFKPNDLAKVEGGNAMLFVYRKNIAGRGTVSNLLGIAGNQERYEDLANTLLTTDGVNEDDGAVVTHVLTDKLVAKEGTEAFKVGYVLQQQRTKTDEVNEEGKHEYLLENRYEIKDFFEITEEALKKYRKAAEKSAKKAQETGVPVTFKTAFDDGTPF